MCYKAYYPDCLSLKDLIGDQFKNLIYEIHLEIGRFDGMLRVNSLQCFIKAFFRTEEALSAAFLETKESSFNDYLINLFMDEFMRDRLVELRNTIFCSGEQEIIIEEKGFRIPLLYELQNMILEENKKKRLSSEKYTKRRHFWMEEYTEQNDILACISSEDKRVNQLMSDLDSFIRSSNMHPLVIVAVAYGQLAMIHPWGYVNAFLNGTLVPYLFNFLGITRERSFYLSGAFRKDKKNYYDYLSNLLKKSDWKAWVECFLIKIKERAISNQNKIDHIMNFYDKLKEVYNGNAKWKYMRSIDAMMNLPLFTPKDLEQKYGLQSGSLNHHLSILDNAGYLVKDNRRKSYHYMFSELPVIMDL